MGILEKIFPRQANNEYRGSPISFYVLCAFAVLFTGRSLIHYFKNDGGANSIASIVSFPGTPDPDTVIYLIFSMWGGQQLNPGEAQSFKAGNTPCLTTINISSRDALFNDLSPSKLE